MFTQESSLWAGFSVLVGEVNLGLDLLSGG